VVVVASSKEAMLGAADVFSEGGSNPSSAIDPFSPWVSLPRLFDKRLSSFLEVDSPDIDLK
jgi:hypothetical protein